MKKQPTERTCRECNILKPITEFRSEDFTNKKDETYKIYLHKCRKCTNQASNSKVVAKNRSKRILYIIGKLSQSEMELYLKHLIPLNLPLSKSIINSLENP